jgi:hypothetical protein
MADLKAAAVNGQQLLQQHLQSVHVTSGSASFSSAAAASTAAAAAVVSSASVSTADDAASAAAAAAAVAAAAVAADTVVVRLVNTAVADSREDCQRQRLYALDARMLAALHKHAGESDGNNSVLLKLLTADTAGWRVTANSSTSAGGSSGGSSSRIVDIYYDGKCMFCLLRIQAIAYLLACFVYACS